MTSHDAAWTLQNKRGTCENYAQLSLALLRSVGIPARYVSGYLVGGDITVSGYHIDVRLSLERRAARLDRGVLS